MELDSNRIKNEIQSIHSILQDSIDSFYVKGSGNKRLSKEQHFNFWDRMRSLEEDLKNVHSNANDEKDFISCCNQQSLNEICENKIIASDDVSDTTITKNPDGSYTISHYDYFCSRNDKECHEEADDEI